MTRRAPLAAPATIHAAAHEAEEVLQEIDREDAEVQAAATLPEVASDGRALANFINAQTSGTLVLFPFVPREREPGKVYPALKGYLDCADARVPVSAFEQRTELGRRYISLAIGERGEVRLGGVMFRAETQDPATGLWNAVPGKKHDRFGWLRKQRKVSEEEGYETIFELRITGSRRLSAAGRPYIRAGVRASKVHGGETMEACF